MFPQNAGPAHQGTDTEAARHTDTIQEHYKHKQEAGSTLKLLFPWKFINPNLRQAPLTLGIVASK